MLRCAVLLLAAAIRGVLGLSVSKGTLLLLLLLRKREMTTTTMTTTTERPVVVRIDAGGRLLLRRTTQRRWWRQFAFLFLSVGFCWFLLVFVAFVVVGWMGSPGAV